MKSVFYNSSLDEAFLADSSLSLTKPKEIKDLSPRKSKTLAMAYLLCLMAIKPSAST